MMKHLQLLVLMLLIMPSALISQNLEVEGTAKITEVIPSFQDTSFQMTEFKFTAPDMKNNFGAYISFTGQDNNNGGAEFARMEWLNASDGNEQSGKLKFYTADDAGETRSAITMDNNQNVGIGTETPNAKLNVVDNLLGSSFNLTNNFPAIANNGISIMKVHGPNIADDSGLLIKFGKSSSFRNEADIRFDYAGSGSGDNALSFGFNSIQPFVFIKADETVGIGTNNPNAMLHVDGTVQVSNNDIYIEDINKGVIMKSPDGNCWRMTVDNAGAVVVTSVVCP